MSLALLDVMACGLGAVILILTLVKFGKDISISEDSILKADLIRLKTEGEQVKQRLDMAEKKNERASREIMRISKLANKLKLEAQSAEDINTTKTEELMILKTNIKQIEIKDSGEVSESENFGGDQYLLGLKVEGQRIGILIDQSGSMTDRRLIDIIGRKNGSIQNRITAPKWQRATRAVQWLLARLPQSSEVAVVAFSDQAKQLGGKGWTGANDVEGLRTIMEAVQNLDPTGSTNLQAGLTVISRIAPSDIYLITDGLPTMGDGQYTKKNIFSKCSSLWGGAQKISGECRLKLFRHTLAKTSLSPEIKVNNILLPLEGDPDAAHAYWLWSASTNGIFISPASSWP